MDQRSVLAENLRVLRAKQNLNIKDAASKVGITRETLRDLENGVRDPYPPTLGRIAAGYGISVRDLLSPAEEPVAAGKAEASEAGPASERGSGKESENASEEERRAVDIGQETPADRIEVLEQGWIPPVRERVERWRAEIDGWRRQGTYPYGRADEMDTYAKVRVLQRAEEIGLMDHVRAVLEREKEVSEREFEACRLLNNELFEQAFALVIKAFEAEHALGLERQGREEGKVARLDALRQDSKTRSTRVRSA